MPVRPSIVVQRVKDMVGNQGFNAQTEIFEDLVETGVIDPPRLFALLCRTPRRSRLLLTAGRVCRASS